MESAQGRRVHQAALVPLGVQAPGQFEGRAGLGEDLAIVAAGLDGPGGPFPVEAQGLAQVIAARPESAGWPGRARF